MPPALPSLKAQVVRGSIVTAAGASVRAVLELGVTLVLARLVSPAEFGLVSMVVAITAFVDLFKDMGLATVAVQRQELSIAQHSTLFWLNVAIGAGLCLLTAAIAPLLSWGYGQPELTQLTLALSVTIFLGSLSLQHQALLRRRLEFQHLAIIEVLGSVVSAACCLGAAVAGLGLWALVVQRLVRPMTTAAASFALARWWPDWPGNAPLKEIIRAGRQIAAFQLTNYVERNLDNVLIGKFSGALDLGCYTRAYELLRLPLTQIGTPVATVGLPALCRLAAEPARYREAYLRMLRQMLPLTIPLCPFLVLCADWVIALTFGPQWERAVPMFQWLGMAMLTKPVAFTTSWLFVSQERTSELARWGFWASGLAVLSFLIGLPWGAVGVSAAYALTDLFVRAPLLFYCVGRTGPIRARDLVVAARPTWAATGLVAVALLAMRESLPPDLPPWQGCLLGAIVTVVVTALGMAASADGRRTYTDLSELMRDRKRQRALIRKHA